MKTDLFEKASVPKAYFTFALLVVLSMVVSLAYNMVDTYFISLTGETNLIAGVALCAPVFTLMLALGDIFGLGGTTWLITIGLLPKFAVKELLERAGQQFHFHQRGGGIVITIPVTGLQGPLLHVLNDEARANLEQRMDERTRKDMAEIREKSGYNVIWVSVGAGYSDDVIDAARAAGAKGGTVLRGRRRNSEHVSQMLGISLQDEQDFVMIVAPREEKSKIMAAICEACGLHTPAHGTVVSLPVDEAIGLER